MSSSSDSGEVITYRLLTRQRAPLLVVGVLYLLLGVLGSTYKLLFGLLWLALWFYFGQSRVVVDNEAIKVMEFGRAPRRVAWSDIRKIQTCTGLGLGYLRVEPKSGRAISLHAPRGGSLTPDPAFDKKAAHIIDTWKSTR